MSVLQKLFLGFVKIHILYHAAREPIFGAWIQEELARHGYRLSSGTLYPTLHRLEQDGYLKRYSRVVRGKARQYYTITEDGEAALEEARQKIGELVAEVIEER